MNFRDTPHRITPPACAGFLQRQVNWSQIARTCTHTKLVERLTLHDDQGLPIPALGPLNPTRGWVANEYGHEGVGKSIHAALADVERSCGALIVAPHSSTDDRKILPPVVTNWRRTRWPFEFARDDPTRSKTLYMILNCLAHLLPELDELVINYAALAPMRWDGTTVTGNAYVSVDGKEIVCNAGLCAVQSTHALEDSVRRWTLWVEQHGSPTSPFYFGGSKSGLINGTLYGIAGNIDRVVMSYDRDRSLTRGRRWECESVQCGLFDSFLFVCHGPCTVTIHDSHFDP